MTVTLFHPFHTLTPLVPANYEGGTMVLPISLMWKLIEMIRALQKVRKQKGHNSKPGLFGSSNPATTTHICLLGLHHKCPQTGWLEIRKFCSIIIGGQKSKVKVFVGHAPSIICRRESFLSSSSFWRPQVLTGLWPHCFNFCLCLDKAFLPLCPSACPRLPFYLL